MKVAYGSRPVCGAVTESGVPDFVRAAAIMGRGGSAVTPRESRADGGDDLQIVGRVGVDVRHLDSAVSVPCPDLPVGGHHHAVRSRPVRRGGAAAGRRGRGESSSHATDAAHVDVALGIDDVHARVRPVGEVVSLGASIDPGNVRARDGVAGNSDHAGENHGSVRPACFPLSRPAVGTPAVATSSALVEGERRAQAGGLLRVAAKREGGDEGECEGKVSRHGLHANLL